MEPTFLLIYGNIYFTLGVFYFDVRCWATQGHSDFLETGVKGHLPSIADSTEMIRRQQVNL